MPETDAAQPVYLRALSALVRQHHESGAYGILLLGLPSMPIKELLLELGGSGEVWASLVAAPEGDGLKRWAHQEGWDEKSFGADEDATHAVQVRNQDTGDAIRLAIAWREEDRLHSLTDRGYHQLGPDEVIRQVATLGVEEAPNTPQQNLWEALASEEVSSHLSLDGIVAYYEAVFGDGDSDPLDTPRKELPRLGLLRDLRLLTQRYASERKIRRRLLSNLALIERMHEDRPEDRKKAHENLKADETLRKAYKALARVRRGDSEAIANITYDQAERLVKFTPDPAPKPPEDEDPEDGPEEEEEPEGDEPEQYSSPAEAALALSASGEGAQAEMLADRIVEHLGQDQEPGRDTLGTAGAEITFDPDDRALALSRRLAGPDRFGGTLETEAPVNQVLSGLGPYVEQFAPFSDVRLEELKLYLERAQRRMPDFEGLELLEDYLEKREILTEPTSLRPGISHADVLASTSATFLYLVAKPEIRQAAKEAIEAYVRLLSHMDARFQELSKPEHATSEGALLIYSEILSLDLICIYGGDEEAVLLSPLNPLLLWKYVEVAELTLRKGKELGASDLDLLEAEVAEMPEPLLALYVPRGPQGDPLDLVYAGRVGELSLYKPSTAEAADVSAEGIKRASEKLAMLYPPAKEDLRLLLVGQQSLEPAAKATQRLLEKCGFSHVSLLISRHEEDEGAQQPPSRLDELHREGRLSITNLPPMGVQELEQRFAGRPVHLLVVARQQHRHGGMISKESTRLHPLSIPSRLETNPITEDISLQPRSNRPPEERPQHPYGLYHDVVSALSGKPHRDRSMREDQEEPLKVYSPLLEHCQFCVTAGVPKVEESDEAFRLTQGSGPLGDTVLTRHDARILSGVSSLIKEGNYVPSDEDVRRLLRRIEDVGGEGVFSTISEDSARGFSKSALQGQIGLAVALCWYRESAEEDRHLVLSLDGYLARQWLGERDNGQRTDLLGFRDTPDGELQVDVIEVKSYAATGGDDIEESQPAGQLRAVARVLYPMFRREGQGDLLLDRRRELLRRQVFQEGLLPSRNGVEPTWVHTLNDLLDGERDVTLSLTLIEVVMGENEPPRADEFSPNSENGDEVDQMPIRRIRLSEPSARKYLGGVLAPREGDDKDISSAGEPRGDGAAGERRAALDEESSETESAPPEKELGEEEAHPAEEATQEGGEAATSATPEGRGADAVPAEGDQALGFELEGEEQEYVRKKAGDIYRALEDIGVSLAEPVDPELADAGPSIIRYKVRLRPGEKVTSVQRRTRDLMRELAVEKEPMVDNLAGTNYVYIDLPRKERRFAHLTPVLEAAREEGRDPYSVPIGAAPDGQVRWLNLTKLPHMLVAGSTGSGKSMFLYAIITGLAYLHPPEALQLVLVDPKRTDFTLFSQLPHLRESEIITDAEAAVDALSHLITTVMEERTELLQEALYRDIHSYNRDHPDDTIPPVFVVIDEFADLSDVIEAGTQEEDFDVALRRLAQRARSVGIHLVVATQRPTTDVVDGTIKANLPCRASFRLGSNVDSRTILDHGGAEHLLGEGDMLLRRDGNTERLQGFYLGDDDLRDTVGEIASS